MKYIVSLFSLLALPIFPLYAQEVETKKNPQIVAPQVVPDSGVDLRLLQSQRAANMTEPHIFCVNVSKPEHREINVSLVEWAIIVFCILLFLKLIVSVYVAWCCRCHHAKDNHHAPPLP